MSISSNPYIAPPVVRRPSVAWYLAAGTLLVAGLVAAAVWVVGAVIGLNDHVDKFPRTSVPGEISAPIDSPDTYYVYYEGTADITLDRLGVTVADPTGEPVTVRPVDGGVLYDSTDRAVGRAVGEFKASTTGRYSLVATGDSAGATIAVGDDLTDDVLPPMVGAGLLFVVTTISGIALAIVAGVRRSNPR
jgi:HAMP domain-containing protein